MQMNQKPLVVENVLPGGALAYKRSGRRGEEDADFTATNFMAATADN